MSKNIDGAKLKELEDKIRRCESHFGEIIGVSSRSVMGEIMFLIKTEGIDPAGNSLEKTTLGASKETVILIKNSKVYNFLVKYGQYGVIQIDGELGGITESSIKKDGESLLFRSKLVQGKLTHYLNNKFDFKVVKVSQDCSDEEKSLIRGSNLKKKQGVEIIEKKIKSYKSTSRL